MTTKLECINPILPVGDMKASLHYYEKVLGFRRADWVSADATFALVLRDGLGIYLCEEPGSITARGCGSAPRTSSRCIRSTRSAARRSGSADQLLVGL